MNYSTNRIIFTRKDQNIINIKELETGEAVTGCCVFCNAPSCLPGLSFFPCWGDAQYIASKRDASKYIFIRENSIEFNEPVVSFKLRSNCCFDPCEYVINDNVMVIFYDDPIFDSITDQLDCGSSCWALCFGSKGEKIRFENKCFYGLCVEGSCPCPIIPNFCPRAACPCYINREVYVKNSQNAIYEIRKARSQALEYHRKIEQTRNVDTSTTRVSVDRN